MQSWTSEWPYTYTVDARSINITCSKIYFAIMHASIGLAVWAIGLQWVYSLHYALTSTISSLLHQFPLVFHMSMMNIRIRHLTSSTFRFWAQSVMHGLVNTLMQLSKEAHTWMHQVCTILKTAIHHRIPACIFKLTSSIHMHTSS